MTVTRTQLREALHLIGGMLRESVTCRIQHHSTVWRVAK